MWGRGINRVSAPIMDNIGKFHILDARIIMRMIVRTPFNLV